MVARETDDSGAPGPLDEQVSVEGVGAPAPAVWRTWRRALAAWLGPLARPRARTPRRLPDPLAALRATRRFLTDPGAVLAESDHTALRRVADTGAVAVALGAAASVAAGALLQTGWPQRLAYVGWLAAWALARLALLRLTVPPSLARRSRDLQAVWGAGLVPYVAALASPLDLVALAASAWITRRGLAAAGVPAHDADRACAVVYGGQLAVEVGAWLARGWLLVALR